MATRYTSAMVAMCINRIFQTSKSARPTVRLSKAMPRIYNFIYSKLVEGNNDVVGHIAYSLYKSDKIKFIDGFKKENNREPDETELKTFHSISNQQDSIDRYRLAAANILRDFMNNTLQESIQNIERECYENHAQILSKIVEPLRPAKRSTIFWHGVLQGVVGAFIFALIVAAFAFIKTYNAG